jgi:hypothetical protein
MKRRGFLKFLAAVPIAIAVRPPKKKKYAHRAPKISNEDIINRHYEIIDEMQQRAVADIQAEEDRHTFAMLERARE